MRISIDAEIGEKGFPRTKAAKLLERLAAEIKELPYGELPDVEVMVRGNRAIVSCGSLVRWHYHETMPAWLDYDPHDPRG